MAIDNCAWNNEFTGIFKLVFSAAEQLKIKILCIIKYIFQSGLVILEPRILESSFMSYGQERPPKSAPQHALTVVFPIIFQVKLLLFIGFNELISG